MNVFLTVDVEVWCDGWNYIDEKFISSFDKYIYGNTRNGSYGLPFLISRLNEFGLKGVFFTEALFSTRFGISPLAEIIGLIESNSQETQLHLHTEWVDESKEVLFPHIIEKRQHIKYFNLGEQVTLLSKGIELMEKAGLTSKIQAFRAGSFALNRDTLKALSIVDIPYDASYNQIMQGSDSGIATGRKLFQPAVLEDIIEYPMSIFIDGIGRERHAQLGACSFREISEALIKAEANGWKDFVILMHNFELLNSTKSKRDPLVVHRFEKLCNFLDKNRNIFSTQGFKGISTDLNHKEVSPIQTSIYSTAVRIAEQSIRSIYH